MALDCIALDRDLADPATLDLAKKVGKRQARMATARCGVLEKIKQRHQQYANDDPKRQILAKIVHRGPSETIQKIRLYLPTKSARRQISDR